MVTLFSPIKNRKTKIVFYKIIKLTIKLIQLNNNKNRFSINFMTNFWEQNGKEGLESFTLYAEFLANRLHYSAGITNLF